MLSFGLPKILVPVKDFHFLFLCLVRDASCRNIPLSREIRVVEYCTSGLFCLQRKHLACEYFLTFCFSRGGVVSASPNPQAGGLPLVGCLRLLIQFIRSYPPYRRPFLYPQPEDAQCRVYRDSQTRSCASLHVKTGNSSYAPCRKWSSKMYTVRPRIWGLRLDFWKICGPVTFIEISHNRFLPNTFKFMEVEDRLILYDAKPLQLIQCSPSTRTLCSVCKCEWKRSSTESETQTTASRFCCLAVGRLSRTELLSHVM